ncbi:MAG TPA: hypothetical protein PKE53_06390 [Flavobacteriales bacterium]|nr:hypothetical protein [Flavobacteriales bacterium]HMU13614.1 hypothetical protein [Flavobacteriales bacterium]
MGITYSRGSIATLIIGLAFTGSVQAQHTIIKKSGGQTAGKVVGIAAGLLRYQLDPTSDEVSTWPCNDVLAIIDERLVVHAGNPCEAVGELGKAQRNCASLLMKDGSVVKCQVTSELDTYRKIRTKDGERTEPDDDVVGIINGDEVDFTDMKFALRFMSDANTVRMINDVSQCPSGYGEVGTTRSAKKNLPRVEAAQKKAAIARAKANSGTVPVVKAPVDTSRGLMEEFDAEKLTAIGVDKVRRLEAYMKVITDGKVAQAARAEQCKQADALFGDAYENKVQSSTVPADGGPVRTRSVIAHDYLTRLLTMGKKYSKVEVEFADLQIGELEMQPDGSYRGIITVQQRFAGEVDGQLVYGDVTVKHIEITIKQYDKLTPEGMKKFWDVFLGDISVVTTQRI